LHKNQSVDGIDEIMKTISGQTLNSVSFDDAVAKTYFFHKITSILKMPTIYFDFDMLYSGYVASGMLQQDENTDLLRPTQERIRELLVNVLEKISMRKHLVILDSLNGFFTMLDQKDSGRLINSMIVLLASAGQHTNSIVLLGSISRFREGQGWILSALGRHVVEIEKMNIISVKKRDSYFQLSLVDRNNFTKSSVQFDLDLI